MDEVENEEKECDENDIILIPLFAFFPLFPEVLFFVT